MRAPEVVVVGSGPNGLAAALTAARAGLRVVVFEGAETPGGGCRTAELTLPGFRHDVCSAVHPLAAASPFFQRSDLSRRGVRLRVPTVAFAHPLDGGRAASVVRSVDETADGLGADAPAYHRVFDPLVRDASAIVAASLAPIRSVPDRPVAVARFARAGLPSLSRLASGFSTEEAKALLAGVAAHAMQPLTAPLTSAYGLLLIVTAHQVGWPVVEGGSSAIVTALVDELESLGGSVVTGRWIHSLDELPAARAVLLDVGPGRLAAMAGGRLPRRTRRALERFAYGPGVCKVDWALAGPVPWTAPVCRAAVTVHLGGTLAEVSESEAEVHAGRHPDRPYCIIVQPGVVDATRAPAGSQTLWGYCHVPAGSTLDMRSRIEDQIERFAPGFRELVLGATTTTAADEAAHNPNYVGGDINGGAATFRQTLFRPTMRWNPYRTGLKDVYLCSASTPPGGGVHGMCGEHAARVALADMGIARATLDRRSAGS
jgi:phytoene dehydrogenase-like protein